MVLSFAAHVQIGLSNLPGTSGLQSWQLLRLTGGFCGEVVPAPHPTLYIAKLRLAAAVGDLVSVALRLPVRVRVYWKSTDRTSPEEDSNESRKGSEGGAGVGGIAFLGWYLSLGHVCEARACVGDDA